MRTGVVDKATALITRRNGDRDEIVVFDHPLAGIQIPSGTMNPGESPDDGALREGWEETGIPHLRVVGLLDEIVEATPGWGHGRTTADVVFEGRTLTRGHYAELLDVDGTKVRLRLSAEGQPDVGWVDASVFCDDVVRSIVQLESDAATPDEWWVFTPDGEGLCWRCRWVPIDAEIGIVAAQADWLERVKPSLRALTPARTLPLPPGAALSFWSKEFYGRDRRFITTMLPADAEVDDARVRRALGVCRTEDDQFVIVSGDGRTLWNFPGGGREAGETLEETVSREILEEACADVTHLRLLGYQHVLEIDEHDNVIDEELQARFAARLTLRDWDPHHEMSARDVVTIDEVRDRVGRWWIQPTFERLLELAVR